MLQIGFCSPYFELYLTVTKCMDSFVWFLSRDFMFVAFVCVVMGGCGSPILIAVYYSIIYRDHIHPFYSK